MKVTDLNAIANPIHYAIGLYERNILNGEDSLESLLKNPVDILNKNLENLLNNSSLSIHDTLTTDYFTASGISEALSGAAVSRGYRSIYFKPVLVLSYPGVKSTNTRVYLPAMLDTSSLNNQAEIVVWQKSSKEGWASIETIGIFPKLSDKNSVFENSLVTDAMCRFEEERRCLSKLLSRVSVGLATKNEVMGRVNHLQRCANIFPQTRNLRLFQAVILTQTDKDGREYVTELDTSMTLLTVYKLQVLTHEKV